ncbi:hypothetical protein B0O99DRAFT_623097 [Bisporella sp. PMI_857]|nr:hypothetical protein B0O99DRAFT_623097 [Bisporella sp. PMI_857]
MRQFHTKSRSGCAQCKSRRIKCDESRPSCRNCVRAKVQCPFLAAGTISRSTPKAGNSRAASASASVSASPSPSSTSPGQVAHMTAPENDPSKEHPGPIFDILDLALMHHFTAVTSLELFLGENQREVWKMDFPRQARSNVMIMHGLLAIAALHMTHLEPEDMLKYRTRALQHHDLGLQIFNSQFKSLTSENSDIMFSFGLTLVVWAFASPSAFGLKSLWFDDLLKQLDHVRGCKTIFQLHREAIVTGPIRKFFDFSHEYPQSVLSPDVFRSIENLKIHAADVVHLLAIENLECHLRKSILRTSDSHIAMAWLALVDDAFWLRVKTHEPVAIMIFAHWAILLRQYQTVWWISGWPDAIVSAVEGILSESDKVCLGWDTCVQILLYRTEIQPK